MGISVGPPSVQPGYRTCWATLAASAVPASSCIRCSEAGMPEEMAAEVVMLPSST